VTLRDFLNRAEWFRVRNGFYPSCVTLDNSAYLELQRSLYTSVGTWGLESVHGIRVRARVWSR
jgi:hypothetical protein